MGSKNPEWLRLTCCSVGEKVPVAWIHNGWVYGWLPKEVELETAVADWVVVKHRDIFDSSQEKAIPVRFCPGCGAKTPTLRRREGATDFHRVESDDDGHCLTCNDRYCSADDPSHVFEVAP